MLIITNILFYLKKKAPTLKPQTKRGFSDSRLVQTLTK